MILSEFSFENFGPFKDKVTLDFRSTKLKDKEDTIINMPDGNRILTSVSIFGANASGKSCVITALSALTKMILFSRPPSMMLPYNPFRLSPDSKNSPTGMWISFYESDIRYEYHIVYNSSTVLVEDLTYYSDGIKQKVFVRKEGKYTFYGKNKSEMRKTSNMVGTNSTFVSVAAQFNNDVCRDVFDAMSKVLVLQGDMGNLLNAAVEWMNHNPKFKSMLIKALKVADFGIDGLTGTVEEKNITEFEGSVPSQIIGLMMATGASKVNQMELSVRHDVKIDGVCESDCTFPYSIESNGTLRMIGVMSPVIHTLLNGGVIAIDEFGAFLDHDICEWIVQLFAGERNPHGAQLVFNTHDRMLMDTELFRRDQIFFASKDRETKVSDLYSLSDFSIRKSYDPRKGFSLGKFDERPRILSERWLDIE